MNDDRQIEALQARCLKLEGQVQSLSRWLQIVSAWAAVRDETGEVYRLIRGLYDNDDTNDGS